MKRAHRFTFLVLGITLLLGFSLLFGPDGENRAQAQSISTSSGLRISASVIGSGGGYQVSGTIGQPLGQVSSNGGFVLRSGFWHMPLEQYVFLPMVRR